MTEDANTRNQDVALADRTVYEDALRFARSKKKQSQNDLQIKSFIHQKKRRYQFSWRAPLAQVKPRPQ